jgi:hypothetical protein
MSHRHPAAFLSSIQLSSVLLFRPQPPVPLLCFLLILQTLLKYQHLHEAFPEHPSSSTLVKDLAAVTNKPQIFQNTSLLYK